MRRVNNIEYYRIDEILNDFDHDLSLEDLKSAFENKRLDGNLIDGQWHSCSSAISYFLENSKERIEKSFQNGIYSYDLRQLNIDGLILDVGAGGEGIIEQCFSDQVVGIAPKEHSTGLCNSPDCLLKVMMDARNMTFINASFDNVTSFFTIMYIDFEDYKRVFEEIYRVLKIGGSFYLWDLIIKERNNKEKDIFISFFEILTNKGRVKTGYGTKWGNRVQDVEFFKALGTSVGFKVIESKSDGARCFIRFEKRPM